MKHVLFIQPSLDAVGGIEKVVPTVAKGLVEREYSVSAFVFYGQVPESQDFWCSKRAQQEIIALGVINKIKKAIRRLRFLREYIKEIKPDYLVVSAQGAIILVVLLRRLGLIRVPVIAYVHEARGDGGIFYRYVTALFYPLADGLIAVSRGIEIELQSLWFVSKKKIYLVYNSLPPLTFDEVNMRKIKDALDLYPRPLYITAGRLEQSKGADVVVESFIQYAKNKSGTLVVLGTGSLYADLEKRVEKNAMKHRIVFLGRVHDVPLYIKHCDAYLSMARSEPFGLALIESLSVGVPVIATDVPFGPREILSPTVVPHSYPLILPYGVLLSPPANTDMNADSLRKGLALFLHSTFEPELLIRRANDFSPERQVDAFDLVLKQFI